MTMVFDSSLHPGHKSLRFPYRDYAGHGTYFVTICTHDRMACLGNIVEGNVQLTPIGEIVRECWLQIPEHNPQAILHASVVMPNHTHGLIQLTPAAGAPSKPDATRRGFGPDSVPPGSLSSVVRSFKSAATRLSRARLGASGELWEWNFFERVIRSGKEFDDTTQYIIENPLKWELDKENPDPAKTLRSR